MKLSIIIPVYNGEDYILSCYNSIKEQLFFLDKEILFINNGSTDKSSEILSELSTDKEVNIISLKEKGVSNARNVGLDCSNGEWVYFMDVDDIIGYADKKIVDDALNKSYDLIWIGHEQVHDGEIKSSYNESLPEKEYDLVQFSKQWQGEGMVWAFIFRRSILKDYFCKDMSFFEDSDFLYRNLRNVKSIYLSHHFKYRYFIRASSTMQASKLEVKYKDAVHGLVRNLELLASLERKPKRVLGRHIVRGYLWVVRSCPDSIFDELCYRLKIVKKKPNLFYGNLKQIIMISLCSFNISLFRKIFRFKL